MSSDGVKFLDLGSVYKGLVECSGDMETYVIDADDGLAALLVQAGSLTLNLNLHTFVHWPIPRDTILLFSAIVYMRVLLKAKLICDVYIYIK